MFSFALLFSFFLPLASSVQFPRWPIVLLLLVYFALNQLPLCQNLVKQILYFPGAILILSKRARSSFYILKAQSAVRCGRRWLGSSIHHALGQSLRHFILLRSNHPSHIIAWLSWISHSPLVLVKPRLWRLRGVKDRKRIALSFVVILRRVHSFVLSVLVRSCLRMMMMMVVHVDLSASTHSPILYLMSWLIGWRVACRVVHELMMVVLRLRWVVHLILVVELHVRRRTLALAIRVRRRTLTLTVGVRTVNAWRWRHRPSLLRNWIIHSRLSLRCAHHFLLKGGGRGNWIGHNRASELIHRRKGTVVWHGEGLLLGNELWRISHRNLELVYDFALGYSWTRTAWSVTHSVGLVHRLWFEVEIPISLHFFIGV